MKVELVQHTPNPVKLITDVASICYGRNEAKNPGKLVRHLHELGHHSTFEHVYYTFKIENISRACLGQLTRHRHASFSVRSQRYCDEGDQRIEMPVEIVNNTEARKYYIDSIQRAYEAYNDMREAGIKKEDARMVLPQASLTELYMSFNLRELIHMFELRTSKQAQDEIHKLVNKMAEKAIEVSPEIKFIFEKENV